MKHHFIFAALALLAPFSLSPAHADAGGDYFPASYDASKARFLGNADHLRKNYRDVEVDSIVVGTEHLTVDTIYIPAQDTPRNLVILTSGNHGVEGYAGSAVQAIFTEKVLPHLDLSHTGVMMIHALNPWGFKHNRRGTESNVNLNRNFSLSPDLFQTRNDAYDQIRNLLEPTGPVKNACAFPALKLIEKMVLEKGVTQESLTEAIGMGQYRSPKGIDFGGTDFEPQTVEVTKLLERIAAPYRAIFNIDLHTGLGKRNVLHIMTKKGMNDVSVAAEKRLFTGSADTAHYELTPPDAEGFYDIHGDFANILGQLFPEPERVIISVTAEFGTVGNGLRGKTVTINRLINENEGYYFGFRTPAIERKVKQRFLKLFFPTDPKWRKEVLTNGRYLTDVVLRRFIAQNP
jgi:predicted deacylase